MYIPNYPEDSTLRRHHDSAAAYRLQEFLDLPPTDSILRRHYEQRLAGQARPATSTRSTTAGPVLAAATSDGGGLLGWLKRLFG